LTLAPIAEPELPLGTPNTLQNLYHHAILALAMLTLATRGVRRFPIKQDVRYQCVKGSRICAVGVGQTVEISSREVRFTTQQPLKQGQEIRLAVNWPALLDNTCRMKLDISGSIVHTEPGEAAVKIERYEFRTRGAPTSRDPSV